MARTIKGGIQLDVHRDGDKVYVEIGGLAAWLDYTATQAGIIRGVCLRETAALLRRAAKTIRKEL